MRSRSLGTYHRVVSANFTKARAAPSSDPSTMRGNAQLVNGRARLIHRSRCSFNQPAFVSLALRYPRSHVVFHPFELLGKYRPPYYFLPTYVALHISSIPALPFYPLYPLRFYPSALTTIFPFVSSLFYFYKYTYTYISIPFQLFITLA